LPGVAHYPVVDPARPMIVHHARGRGDTIVTRVMTQGRIAPDPPGIEIAVAAIHDEAKSPE
jgi:hypothetical protein